MIKSLFKDGDFVCDITVSEMADGPDCGLERGFNVRIETPVALDTAASGYTFLLEDGSTVPAELLRCQEPSSGWISILRVTPGSEHSLPFEGEAEEEGGGAGPPLVIATPPAHVPQTW
jgi:hypothetical protein